MPVPPTLFLDHWEYGRGEARCSLLERHCLTPSLPWHCHQGFRVRSPRRQTGSAHCEEGRQAVKPAAGQAVPRIENCAFLTLLFASRGMAGQEDKTTKSKAGPSPSVSPEETSVICLYLLEDTAWARRVERGDADRFLHIEGEARSWVVISADTGLLVNPSPGGPGKYCQVAGHRPPDAKAACLARLLFGGCWALWAHFSPEVCPDLQGHQRQAFLMGIHA